LKPLSFFFSTTFLAEGSFAVLVGKMKRLCAPDHLSKTPQGITGISRATYCGPRQLSFLFFLPLPTPFVSSPRFLGSPRGFQFSPWFFLHRAPSMDPFFHYMEPSAAFACIPGLLFPILGLEAEVKVHAREDPLEKPLPKDSPPLLSSSSMLCPVPFPRTCWVCGPFLSGGKLLLNTPPFSPMAQRCFCEMGCGVCSLVRRPVS